MSVRPERTILCLPDKNTILCHVLLLRWGSSASVSFWTHHRQSHDNLNAAAATSHPPCSPRVRERATDYIMSATWRIRGCTYCIYRLTSSWVSHLCARASWRKISLCEESCTMSGERLNMETRRWWAVLQREGADGGEMNGAVMEHPQLKLIHIQDGNAKGEEVTEWEVGGQEGENTWMIRF